MSETEKSKRRLTCHLDFQLFSFPYLSLLCVHMSNLFCITTLFPSFNNRLQFCQEIMLQHVMSQIAAVKKDMVILEKSEFTTLLAEYEVRVVISCLKLILKGCTCEYRICSKLDNWMVTSMIWIKNIKHNNNNLIKHKSVTPANKGVHVALTWMTVFCLFSDSYDFWHLFQKLKIHIFLFKVQLDVSGHSDLLKSHHVHVWC